MSIRPFKYLLQAVAVEVDNDSGRLLREIPAEPVTVYSAEQAVEVIEGIEKQIVAMNNGKVESEIVVPSL